MIAWSQKFIIDIVQKAAKESLWAIQASRVPAKIALIAEKIVLGVTLNWFWKPWSWSPGFDRGFCLYHGRLPASTLMKMEDEMLRWSITKNGVTKSFSQGKNKCMRDWDEYENILLIHCIWLLDVAMSSAGQYNLGLDSRSRTWRILDLSLTSMTDRGPNLISFQSLIPIDLNHLWPLGYPRKRLDNIYFCVANPLIITNTVISSTGV